MFDSVSLQSVRQVINFAGRNSSFNGDDSIPELQTKGVTALCKILQERQYAYLADEVGMGKTYQAIGVIAMFLEEKPDAKVLIIAPNSSVQDNWVSEIKNFQRNNLNKNVCMNVRNFVNGQDFLKSYKEKKSENVFLARLTTFSTMGDAIARFNNNNSQYSYNDKISIRKLYEGLCRVTGIDVNTEYSEKFNSFDSGKICGKFLRKFTANFDLVVVDEAQNLRNENNATVFLNYWLGLKRCKDSKKTSVGEVLNGISSRKNDSKFLLLSATPAHRNVGSLRAQLLYFEENGNVPASKDIDHEFLEHFLIRRLRAYDKDCKYDVRNISPNDVAERLEKDDEYGLKQRLFLALIQSKLAQIKAKNNAAYKIGFLETFESYRPSEEKLNDEETGEMAKEFENYGSHEIGESGEAPDKKILQNISKSFDKLIGKGKYPPHPKFSFMEDEIKELLEKNLPLVRCGCNRPDKSLIFVRRLASVRELELRLNKLYEDRIVSYWGNELGLSNACFYDIQKAFETMYDEKTSTKNDEKDLYENNVEAELLEKTEDVGALQSRSNLIKWLALKKYHKGVGYYAVSKFKKSLLKNKPNSILFSENYFTELYGVKEVDKIVDDDFVKEVNEYIAKERNRYILEYGGKRKYNPSEILPLCCFLALRRKGDTEMAKFIKDFYKIGDSGKIREIAYSKTLIRKTLLQDSIWNHLSEFGVNVDIVDSDLYQREVLKSIVEKYLKSSEAVLELMYCYLTAGKDENICASIMKRLFSGKCTYGVRIKLLFDNGNLVCKQLLGGDAIEHECDLESKLDFLNLQQWVMPAIGGNKGNEGLIKRFNTPFYPDVIVCTDVLKEGINLHLFCNRIYHYGLAWTPGDLEQRAGRVDRFFSKTHRERTEQQDLPKEQKTKIEINFPYLGKSVDEHQLKQVLKFKLSADPLLDSRNACQKDIQIDLTEKTVKELAAIKPEELDICPYSGEKFWSK